MGSWRGTGGAARGAQLSPECRPDVAISVLTTHTCVLRGWRQGPGIRAGSGLRGSCGARWARKACHDNRVGMNWCHLIFLHLDVNCESSKNKQLCHLTSGTLLFSSNSFLTYECTRALSKGGRAGQGVRRCREGWPGPGRGRCAPGGLSCGSHSVGSVGAFRGWSKRPGAGERTRTHSRSCLDWQPSRAKSSRGEKGQAARCGQQKGAGGAGVRERPRPPPGALMVPDSTWDT